MSSIPRKIHTGTALIPVFFLVVSLAVGIVLFKQSPHIPLILATTVAAVVALLHGHSWKDMQEGMVHSILIAMDAILILFIVGTMIGTWIQGGIVPAMIYYGLKVLSPGIFLIATLLICSIVALGSGSSWSTAGTVGVALIGIGKGLGIPVSMVAGAIISGAYFGDKMSPLSDTTNLAPAVAGSDLFAHIRHMMYTTIPAYLIAIVIFGLLGTKFSGGSLDTQNIESILATIKNSFFIHPLLLLAPAVVIFMVIKRVPPLPALFVGTLLGALSAVITQSTSFSGIVSAAFSGHVSQTGHQAVDALLTRGGLMNMMDTVGLIFCALSFGGVMEKTGMLQVLAGSLLKRVHKTGSLIATTLASSIAMNAIAPNQYMSIVIPGRMFKGKFDELGLKPVNLSRCLEDAGTMSSPLIPWNSCGAFMHVTLGVSPLVYLPFAFVNLLTPLISLIYGYTGFTILKEDDTKK